MASYRENKVGGLLAQGIGTSMLQVPNIVKKPVIWLPAIISSAILGQQLIGIGGAMLGFPVLDPLASVVICIFILKVAFDIFKDALDKMLDTSCSEEYEEKLADYIRKSRGVERLDLLRTRMFGNKVYIDAEIAVDGTLSLKDAHAIAEDVHDNVEKKFPNTKHIMIHVNPA